MNRRNIANYSTFNTITCNFIEIQNTGAGLIMYDTDRNNPTFELNASTKEFNMLGDLNVTGNVTFDNMTSNELDAGLQELAATNAADEIDIGIFGKYNNGADVYTGIARDADDSLKRWTFFDNIDTLPDTTIEPITTSNLASVRMSFIYINDGTVSLPSLTFNSDVDTGLYRETTNELGITAGGIKVMGIRALSPSETELELNANTKFRALKFDITNAIASVDVPAISSGFLCIDSESALDKWWKLHSALDAGTPSYAGLVFEGTTTQYFITNDGNTLKFVYEAGIFSPSSTTDYRSSSLEDLIIFNGNTDIQFSKSTLFQAGSLGNLSIKFSNGQTTGIYSSSSGSIDLVSSGTSIVNISSSKVYFSQEIELISGSVSTPAIHFSTDTNTGLYHPNTNEVAISTNGSINALFRGGVNPQVIMPIGGNASTPRYAFDNGDTGIYSPIDEAADHHLAFSLGGVETFRLRALNGIGQGDIEFFNSVLFTPNGNFSKVVINDNNTIIMNTLKANSSSFQSYNIIDKDILLLLNFFNENDIGKDTSGNNFDATATSNLTIKDCEKDLNNIIKKRVLDFSVNSIDSEYLSLTEHLLSFTSLNSVSFSFWFKTNTSISGILTIFNFYSPNGNISAKINTITDILQVTIEGDQDGGQTLQFNTNSANISVVDGIWHHVIIRMGVTSPHMYFDGEPATSANSKLQYTISGNNASGSLATDTIQDLSGITQFTIGATFDGTLITDKYLGFLKDFYVTGRGLTLYEASVLATINKFDTHTIDCVELDVCDINIKGNINIPDGNATNPSIAFITDLDTGIYNDGEGVVAFSSNGSEKLRITPTITNFSSGLEINEASEYIKISNSDLNNKLVFESTGDSVPLSPHLIQSSHNSNVSLNYMEILLSDLSNGVNIGDHTIIRFGQTAAGPNAGLITIFGPVQGLTGSASNATYSFTGDESTGMYRSSSGNLSFSSSGQETVRFSNSIITLFEPIIGYGGSATSPDYSFSGDTNTGIYNITTGQIGITTAGTLRQLITETNIISEIPHIIDVNSSEALLVRKNGDIAGGDIFAVDTTNNRISLGYTNLFIQRQDTFDNSSVQRILINSPSSNTHISGISLLNTNHSGTNITTSQLNIGKDTGTRNYGNILFHYVGDGSTSNRLSLGINGFNNNMIELNGSKVVINSDFEVTGTSITGQSLPASGSAGAPSYSFSSDIDTGIYNPAAGEIGFSTNGSLQYLITETYNETYNIVRFPNGSVSLPSITFTNDTSNNTGLYWISNNNVGLTANGVLRLLMSSTMHHSYVPFHFTPNGSNLRMIIENSKIRATSNQTILEKNPVLHFNFRTDPNTNLTEQDTSITKSIIQIFGSVAHNTNTLNLTDSNGKGLLKYYAIDLNSGNNGIRTTSDLSNFTLLDEFKFFMKFKLKSAPSATEQLFVLHGNTAINDGFIQVYLNSISQIVCRVEYPDGTLFILATTTSTFSVNVWYELSLEFNSSGNSLIINGSSQTLTYSIGSNTSTFNISGLSDTTNIALSIGYSLTNGTSCPAMYVSEFYIEPISTSESLTKTYPLQIHEVYTNKLQLVDINEGIVDAGSMLISDYANNAVWDNSISIKPSHIELSSTKTLRVPDGTFNNPSYSFTTDSNTGFYRIGNDEIGISTNGTKKMSIGTIIDYSVPSRIEYQTGNSQLLIGSDGDITSGLLLRTLDLSAITGLGGSLTDTEIYTNIDNSFINVVHQTGGGINIRNSDSTLQTNFSLYGSNGTNYNQALNITTIDSGTTSDVKILAHGTNNPAIPQYSFLGDDNTGLYYIGSDNLGISTGGVKRIDISDTLTQIDTELQLNSGFRHNVEINANTSITLDNTQSMIEVSSPSNVNITLPEANASNRGREYHIIKTGSTGTITINTFDANDHIDNNSTTFIQLNFQFDKLTLICNGVNRWYTM